MKRRTAVLLISLTGCFGRSPDVSEDIRSTESDLRRRPEVGPFEARGVGGGGALFGPTISPFNKDEIYVGTDMTDLYHSLDFGASWQTIPFSVVQGDSFTSTQFTADPRLLYALSNQPPHDDPILVKSSDGGRTWSQLLAGTNVNYVSADQSSTERLIAVDSNNVYFSKNAGATFATVFTSGDADGLVMGGAFWRGADIFVGTNDGLLVSHDNGQSFALAAIGGIPAGEGIVSFAGARRGQVTRFYAVTSSAPYAGMTGGDVGSFAHAYRLTDGDDRWSAMNVPLATHDALSFVATALNDVNVAYVAGGNLDTALDVVYKTGDGGITWRSCFLTNNNQNLATGWAGAGGWAGLDWGSVLGLAVAPNDSSRVVLSDLVTVHVTVDGAREWHAAYVKPPFLTPPGQLTPIAKPSQTNGLDNTSVWYLTWANPHTIFTSITDIRSQWSNDGGHTWIRPGDAGLDLNTTYHAVRDPKSGKIYAGLSEKHDLYQSTTLTDDRIDPYGGQIRVSSDDGRHFQLLEDIGHTVIFLALDPHHSNLLYASVVHSQYGDIYRKDLNSPGTPAVRLASPPRTSGHPFNIWVLDDGSLLASYSGHRTGVGSPRSARGPFSASSGVFLSTDGGASWSDRSDPNMQYWTKDVIVDPSDRAQNTWFAGVYNDVTIDGDSGGGLYRTTDRGLHWTRLAGSFNVESLSIDPKHPNRALYSTETRGLWLSTNIHDPQPTFTLVDSYPFRQPLRIFFNPYDDGEVWVTSFGGGMRVARME